MGGGTRGVSMLSLSSTLRSVNWRVILHKYQVFVGSQSWGNLYRRQPSGRICVLSTVYLFWPVWSTVRRSICYPKTRHSRGPTYLLVEQIALHNMCRGADTQVAVSSNWLQKVCRYARWSTVNAIFCIAMWNLIFPSRRRTEDIVFGLALYSVATPAAVKKWSYLGFLLPAPQSTI